MWKNDCEGKIVEQKIVKERLSSEDYERKKDCERKIVKGELKDRLRAKCWKRKPAEIWEVILDHLHHFPEVKKNGLPTDGPTNQRTNQQGG